MAEKHLHGKKKGLARVAGYCVSFSKWAGKWKCLIVEISSLIAHRINPTCHEVEHMSTHDRSTVPLL